MEYYKEYWERWECRYWLRAIESCRKCLFETLCRLEKTGSLVNKRNKSEWLKQSKQWEEWKQVLDPNQQ